MRELNDSWCPAPWTGCVVNSDGSTAVCPIGPRVALDAAGRFDGERLGEIKSAMLRGERLRDCEKCWVQERDGAKSLRRSYLDILEGKIDPGLCADPAYDPRFYFDLSLSNRCNQRCRICGPSNSTGWFKDAENLEHLPWTHVSGQRRVRSAGELMPVVLGMMAASPQPLDLELKGGEPLYLPEVRELLSGMISRGLNERTSVLKVLTNGTVTDPEILEMLKAFPAVDISISVDATGRLHEYTRGTGVSWDECRRSWQRLAGLPNLNTLSIANTIYIYNIFDQLRLYEWANRDLGITRDMSHAMLTRPLYLNVKIMPDGLRERAVAMLDDHPMRRKLDGVVGMLTSGVDDADVMPSWSRKQSVSAAEVSLRISRLRGKFRDFTNALDDLRGEYLLDLVPELAPMMA